MTATRTADNVDDEQEGALSVLDDDINDSVEEELKAVFEDLGRGPARRSDRLLLGRPGHVRGRRLGRGDGRGAATSSAAAPTGAIDELMEQPMLASVLESGLAAFDLSCDGIGDLS